MATETLDKKKPATPPAEAKPVNEKSVEDFTAAFLGNDKPEEAKPADEPPKPAAAPKPKPEAKKPKPAPAAPAISADGIAEAAARGVATALKKVEEAKPVAEPDSKLSADEQKRVATLKHMETANPEKYKGVAKRYEDSLAKFSEYADKWEKDHPGEDFDEDADEHKAFRESNEKGLDWEDEDYTEARADIKATEAVEKVRQENAGKFQQIEQAEKLREAAPAIATAKIATARKFWEKFGGDFKDLVGENGAISPELFKKLSEADPIQWEIATNTAELAEKLIEENHKLFGVLVPFNPRNPLHNTLNQLIINSEQKLMAMPPEDRLDGQGRKFYPAVEFKKLDKDQRKTAWTITQKEIETLILNVTLKQARATIKVEQEKFERTLKARGIQIPAKAAAAPKPAEEVEREEKPRTPAPASSPRISSPAGGAAPENDPQEKFLVGFLG